MSATPRSKGRDRRNAAIAAGIFLLATVVTYADVWRAGPTTTVAVQQAKGAFRITTRADATYQAWLVSRHAHTLLRRPWRLFDTEHCAPAQKTLTLGIPMLTLGLLAVPGAILFDEPVLVYNLALALLTLTSAFAMYLLVARWSGVPAAGWVAGLLFAFQPLRLGHVTHPSVWDVSWTVFALFFAERFFATGRWRDAIGLGASIALQVGASFYPLLAAVFLAPPFLVWLLLRDRLRKLRPGPAAVVLLFIALAVAIVLLPYLGAETDRGGLVRTRFHYLLLGSLFRPDHLAFPGWTVLGLGGVALAVGGRRATPGIDGDPRGPLLLGALLVLLVALGPGARVLFLPNLHALLAGFVPGLDAIRGIERLVSGVELVGVLLAGLGVGVLVRAAGARGPWVAAALLAIAAFDLLRLPAAGLERRYAWRLEQIRPDDESIAFFEALEARGNRGAVLELPMGDPGQFTEHTSRILVAGFHGRRTSACFGSYRPPGREALDALIGKLPSAASVRTLREQGFTTIVVHASPGRPDALKLAARLARDTSGRLVPIYVTERHAAYRLVPEPRTGAAAPR